MGLIAFLEKQTRKRFDLSLNGWRAWMWSLPYEPHPDYLRFKGMVYGGGVDIRMQRFFPPGSRSLIRLDEIDWGGVVVNGIPPLYYPKVLTAKEARYLRDGNIVFGVVVNGQARGSLSPDDPHWFLQTRKEALKKADLVLIFGTPLDFRLSYGRAIAKDAKLIQVDLEGRELHG